MNYESKKIKPDYIIVIVLTMLGIMTAQQLTMAPRQLGQQGRMRAPFERFSLEGDVN
jgi:hypothetical protein